MAESPSLDKKLRDCAFILALIEKGASTLGTMNFIWATVVLLGGFSQSLKSIDFWFVSVILVVEGLRILCRRGELATRRSSSPGFSVTTLIYVYSLAIQEYSTVACIVLSSLRVQKQQYGSDGNLNRNRALNIFYWLCIVESILTLFGFLFRASLSDPKTLTFDSVISDPEITFFIRFIPIVPDFYRRFISIVRDLCKKMTFSLAVGQNWCSALREDGFDHSQLNTLLPFFHETYSRCINGSVFDGLKIDFVSYSVELLQSIDYTEQLTGGRLLSVLLKSDRLPSEKLRVIRTTPGLLERLIEMLNWEKPIQTVAADIILKLVEIPQNRIRVDAIPESRESIKSLLGSGSEDLGLRILKFFDDDHDNRAKMGTNRVVLRKIIEFIKSNPEATESEILRQFEIMLMETPASLARKQDVRDNTHETSGIKADHSDYPNLQSVSIQV